MSFCIRLTTQLRVSFGGVVGLDYNAVYRMAETFFIDMDVITMQKIQLFEAAMLDWAKKESDKKNG